MASPASRDADARRARAWERGPRRLAALFALLALVLVPWTYWLASELPSRHVARHWDVAWGGFDAGLAAVLLATAVAILRRSRAVQGWAAATTAMLCCDAWFDVVTQAPGRGRAIAIAEAALVELPLALLCLWLARRGLALARRDVDP